MFEIKHMGKERNMLTNMAGNGAKRICVQSSMMGRPLQRR